MSATMPTLTSRTEYDESAEPCRTSHAEMRSIAPPMQRPWTAAMVGVRAAATESMA